MGIDYDQGHFGPWSIDNPDCVKFVAMTVMYGILFFISADALFALRSKSLKSYRKVMRSCVTFSIAAIVTALFTSGTNVINVFEFNALITTALMYALFVLIVSSDAAKEYYTPFGKECPETKEWVRFSFFGKMEFENKVLVYDSEEN